MRHDALVKQLADAQAAIAALEQRVKELKQWVQDQSTANLETMRHMDEMQSRALEAESQLTQRTVELHETQNHLADADNEVEQLRKQLSERTAELEAASKAIAEWRKEIDSVLDKLDGREGDVVALQAELERVKGELQSAEAGYFVAERDLQGANNKYDELRTLIAALPKVKGAVEVSAGDDGWYILPLWIRCVTKEQAEGYVALLQHRQGMEG